MKIALAQINPIIGDLEGNFKKASKIVESAKDNNCDLVVFPELSIMGYPPRDLLFRKDFINKCNEALKGLISISSDIGILVGTVEETEDKMFYNSAFLLNERKVVGKIRKTLIPDYDVFEESRYFKPSDEVSCFDFKGKRLAVTICEDIWYSDTSYRSKAYSRDVLSELYKEGCDIIINMSASPYHNGKYTLRYKMISELVEKYDVPFIYVNQVGGNDELIFDGSSMVFDKKDNLIMTGKHFEEDFLIYDTENKYKTLDTPKEDIGWVFKALVTGMKDYFAKTGFEKTLIGLSGGIDSALAACIAVEALGKGNVVGVSMPSRYSSQHSKDDAKELADNLGIEYRVIPIEGIFTEFLNVFNDKDSVYFDLAEENIQARIRGSILMFLANRENRMLISTGNKSESAVGYSTLYGDMCGGLSVIGDVPKTIVYELSRYINRKNDIIPINIIEKAPSAELRPDQKDEDSLPPYDVLDAIISMYVEEKASVEYMVSQGYDKENVLRIINMVDRAEYKRRQAAPVLKVTGTAFGMGRRIPIAQKFK